MSKRVRVRIVHQALRGHCTWEADQEYLPLQLLYSPKKMAAIFFWELKIQTRTGLFPVAMEYVIEIVKMVWNRAKSKAKDMAEIKARISIKTQRNVSSLCWKLVETPARHTLHWFADDLDISAEKGKQMVCQMAIQLRYEIVQWKILWLFQKERWVKRLPDGEPYTVWMKMHEMRTSNLKIYSRMDYS